MAEPMKHARIALEIIVCVAIITWGLALTGLGCCAVFKLISLMKVG